MLRSTLTVYSDSLMLAGIVVQLVIMLVFVAFGLLWAHRALPEIRAWGPDIRTLLLAGILLPSVMIVVRGCYRTGELSQGFSGSLAVRSLSPPNLSSTLAERNTTRRRIR